MNAKERHDLIAHMIYSLDTPSKALTPWEIGFIASVDDQFARRGDLSEKTA